LSDGRDVVRAVGESHPEVLDAFEVAERVAILEVNLSILLSVEPKVAQWKATSRFPSSDIDLAFTVPNDVTAEKVEKSLRQAAGSLLVALDLFDVYRTGGDERSLAYRLRLQSPDRTLTDADVAAVRDKCISAAGKLGAVLRG
ncbi:MAG: phenylalanine--tRNA ligase subunit beta, partial [Ilumatobacteraceae bacterium]